VVILRKPSQPLGRNSEHSRKSSVSRLHREEERIASSGGYPFFCLQSIVIITQTCNDSSDLSNSMYSVSSDLSKCTGASGNALSI
jgi:hypothetical protein